MGVVMVMAKMIMGMIGISGKFASSPLSFSTRHGATSRSSDRFWYL